METTHTTVRKPSSDIEFLERRYWAAMQSGDVKTAVELTAFPCIVTGPQGARSVSKAEYETMMKAMPYRISSFEISGVIVERPTPTVAVISYALSQALEVDGEPLSMEVFDSSTWVQLNGSWKCVAHSEALKGDPFGREDRSVH